MNGSTGEGRIAGGLAIGLTAGAMAWGAPIGSASDADKAFVAKVSQGGLVKAHLGWLDSL